MTPERWRRVKAVVQAALARPAAERPAVVAAACGDDAALRAEVESLLAVPETGAELALAPSALLDVVGALAGAADASTRETVQAARLATALDGRYAVERELGRGGMATVYLARDLRHGRPVALKVLRPELSAALGAGRFLREIALTAALQHPHVLPLHDSGDADGLLYYVMPYVEGESLRARLQREGALPLADAVRLVRELADALAYAHGEGVVHRDLKPENILLSRRHAVVADFGVAKALASAAWGAGAAETATGTAFGVAVGTPAYMAPEQAAADPATDHRADLYALGLIAYEALAGVHPFAGRSPQALFAADVTTPPRSLAECRPEVPAALAALVARLLAKRPADRPQSAGEVLRQLDAATSDRTSGAPAPPSAARRILRSRAARTGLVALGALALGAAAVLARDRLAAEAPAADALAGPTSDEPVRLAILPFENRGPAGDEDFADGLADAIRGQLAALPALAVIDSRSTGGYGDGTKDVREIGRELGVAYVLQGTVRWERRPDGTRRVQVRPALVRVADATTRWAAPYTAEPTDLFQVEAEIAARVASALAVALGRQAPAVAQAPATPPTSDPDAYEAYVRGLGLWQRANVTYLVPDLRATAAAFARAVALDPQFGVAWAQLAEAQIYAYSRGGGRDAALLDSARAALATAVRLAPDAPETHTATGAYAAYVDGSFERAANQLQRVRDLRPGDARTLTLQALALAWTPRFHEALPAFARAAELDPRTPPVDAANHFRRAGRYAEAIRYADRAIALAPGEITGYNLKALALVDSGAGIAAARAVLDSAVARVGPTAVVRFLAESWTTDAGGMLGGRYEAWQDALTLADYGRDATPNDSMAYYRTKAFAWRRRGDPSRLAAYCDSAIRVLEPMVRPHAAPDVRDLTRVPTVARTPLGYLAQMYACGGRRTEARRLADAFLALRRSGAQEEGGTAFLLGRIYLMLGDADAAVEQFERLPQPPHNRSVAWLRADPFYAPLRGHPRFEALVARAPR